MINIPTQLIIRDSARMIERSHITTNWREKRPILYLT
jgi:hypothetical protein